MKNIEKIKFYFGIILIIYSILGGLIFYLESFEILDELFDDNNLSYIFRRGYGDGSGASNTPNFLGLCAVAGSILLATTKNVTRKENNPENEESVETE